MSLVEIVLLIVLGPVALLIVYLVYVAIAAGIANAILAVADLFKRKP